MAVFSVKPVHGLIWVLVTMGLAECLTLCVLKKMIKVEKGTL